MRSTLFSVLKKPLEQKSICCLVSKTSIVADLILLNKMFVFMPSGSEAKINDFLRLSRLAFLGVDEFPMTLQVYILLNISKNNKKCEFENWQMEMI